MKRFYCTVCRKMKRVQKWPVVIQSVDSVNPADRVGQCNRHNQSAYVRIRKVGNR